MSAYFLKHHRHFISSHNFYDFVFKIFWISHASIVLYFWVFGYKAPAVDVNSLAPQVSTPVPSATTTPTSRTVQNNISINGKTISIPVAEENQGNFNDFLSELEMLKKGM